MSWHTLAILTAGRERLGAQAGVGGPRKGVVGPFEGLAEGGTAVAELPVGLKVLHAKIGQLTLENNFLESAQTSVGLRSASDD